MTPDEFKMLRQQAAMGAKVQPKDIGHATPRTAALKTKIAQTIRMLQLLNESAESYEKNGTRTLDKINSDLREVATMCGDLRVELATMTGKR